MGHWLVCVMWCVVCVSGLAVTSQSNEEVKDTLMAEDVAVANSTSNQTTTNGKILIGVVSAPKHEDARNAIRNTWGALSAEHSAKFDVKFFVGELSDTLEDSEKSRIESNLRFPDVVRLQGFTEHYSNLTKKAKGIISWAHANNYTALMKVDDDSFVRVENLHSFVTSHHNELDSIYSGHINRAEYGECTVHKNPNSKWYMYDQYPFENFPDFADGPGILIGHQMLEFIALDTSLPDYRCDDAAIGIWTQNITLSKIEMPCSIYEFSCSSSHIFTNPVSAGEMFSLQNFPQICESGYNIEICLDKPCLCKGHPERSKCWQDIIDQPYQDIIPRL